MNTVFIKQLLCYATIGIFAWERQIKQKLMLDLEIYSQVSLKQDQTARYDYAAIAKRLTETVEQSEFEWLEDLLETLAKLLTVEFNITHAKLSISKIGAVANAVAVGVAIEIKGA